MDTTQDLQPAATAVRLVYLARLRDAFGTGEETAVLPPSVRTAGDVVRWLAARGEPWSGELAAGRAVRVAVDHALAAADTPLAGAREIALLPPVTGG
ncbi:MAG: MoaD/ThiS family protein [Proteobacteria bacterium]|nr:MoaD/ThiS family protein [Pseudomonadota bacterium]